MKNEQNIYQLVFADLGAPESFDQSITAVIHLILDYNRGSREKQTIRGLSHIGLICESASQESVKESLAQYGTDDEEAFDRFKGQLELALAQKDEISKTAELHYVSHCLILSTRFILTFWYSW